MFQKIDFRFFFFAQSFPLESGVFSREYRTGLYSVDIYFMCKVLAEVNLLFCTCVAFFLSHLNRLSLISVYNYSIVGKNVIDFLEIS